MRTRAWAAFWVLGLIWGSSFLLISIGVKEFKPAELVFIRTGIAAVGLNALLWLRGIRYPQDWPTRRALIIIGLGNVVAPFFLITWGEQNLESGIAGVLQASAALFTLIVAHFAFADEQMTWRKIIGIIVGFIGVIVLFSRDSGDTTTVAGVTPVLGQLAIIAASFCYAVFTTYSRKLLRSQIEPLVVSAGTLTTGAVVSGVVALGSPWVAHTAPMTFAGVSANALIAVIILGLLNTFIAYVFYYGVVRELGAARASMVTFIVPMISLALGTFIAREPFDLLLAVGALLIFGGIGVVNLRLSLRRKAEPLTAVHSSK